MRKIGHLFIPEFSTFFEIASCYYFCCHFYYHFCDPFGFFSLIIVNAFENWPASYDKLEFCVQPYHWYGETFSLCLLKLKITGKSNSDQHGQDDKPHLDSI